MLFNSYIFVMLFLPFALLGYYILNRIKKYQAGMLFLLAVSLLFVGYMNVLYLPILLASILCNYGIYILLKKQDKILIRKLVLAFGVFFNVALLFVFKYYDFFAENVNNIFKSNIPLLELLLPLGISFYTFQQLTFLIDCYRDNTIRVNFLEYALYISFFPQFIQGPIALQSEIIPQLRDKANKNFQCEAFARGMYVFAMGIGKKVLLADTLSKVVNAGYDNIDKLNSPSAILVILAYTLQIYFDFSGYCDMALGLGEMFQIRIPINFNLPYKSTSIDEFWDRWHITLTRFFTRYVYIPLGGSRKGKIRTYLNILIIFFLSGLWHGAAVTFIVWGLLHGVAMVVSRFLKQMKIKIPKALGWICTFIFVNVAWVFFRADTLERACDLFKKVIFGGFGSITKELYESIDKIVEISIVERLDIFGFGDIVPGYYLIILIIILIPACVFMKNTQEKMGRLKFNLREIIVTAVILFVSIISFSGISEFIYFNF